MGNYPNDRSNDPMGPITYGRDFNFFANVIPTITTSGVFNFDADIAITFPSYTVTFLMVGAGALQYSFNGNTIHGEMSSGPITAPTVAAQPAFLTFQNRQITKVWFSGTGTVRVEAWGIR